MTGHLLAPACGPTRTEADFLAHLQAVVATQPEATRWHVVCDQLNTHQSASLVRWVAEISGMQEDLGIKGEGGILASMASRALPHGKSSFVSFKPLFSSDSKRVSPPRLRRRSSALERKKHMAFDREKEEDV